MSPQSPSVHSATIPPWQSPVGCVGQPPYVHRQRFVPTQKVTIRPASLLSRVRDGLCWSPSVEDNSLPEKAVEKNRCVQCGCLHLQRHFFPRRFLCLRDD